MCWKLLWMQPCAAFTMAIKAKDWNMYLIVLLLLHYILVSPASQHLNLVLIYLSSENSLCINSSVVYLIVFMCNVVCYIFVAQFVSKERCIITVFILCSETAQWTPFQCFHQFLHQKLNCIKLAIHTGMMKGCVAIIVHCGYIDSLLL